MYFTTIEKLKWFVTGRAGQNSTWHTDQVPAVCCLPADCNQEAMMASVRPVLFFSSLLVWAREAKLKLQDQDNGYKYRH